MNVTCSVTASEIPSFVNATWEEISYASQNNLIPDTWLIDDERDETLLNGETLTFQIYGLGHDPLAWLTGELWDSLPSDLQAVIQPVTKYTSEGNASTTILSETMFIFLFSEVELLGSVSNSVVGEGTQYQSLLTMQAERNICQTEMNRLTFGG